MLTWLKPVARNSASARSLDLDVLRLPKHGCERRADDARIGAELRRHDGQVARRVGEDQRAHDRDGEVAVALDEAEASADHEHSRVERVDELGEARAERRGRCLDDAVERRFGEHVLRALAVSSSIGAPVQIALPRAPA